MTKNISNFFFSSSLSPRKEIERFFNFWQRYDQSVALKRKKKWNIRFFFVRHVGHCWRVCKTMSESVKWKGFRIGNQIKDERTKRERKEEAKDGELLDEPIWPTHLHSLRLEECNMKRLSLRSHRISSQFSLVIYRIFIKSAKVLYFLSLLLIGLKSSTFSLS